MIESPLFALALTLVGYEVCEIVYLWSGRKLLLNPLIWSVALIIGVLVWTGLPYDTYFAGAKFVHFLLGPATVALAVPLYEQRAHIARVLVPLGAALVAGSLTSVVVAGGLTLALGGSRALVFTLAPKSVTTPIAMVICEMFGGLPPLTAGVVVVTGVFGAATIPLLYAMLEKFFGPHSGAAKGFGLGMAAHGVGTARAFQEDNEMGTFAGLAIGLNGLLTALLIPLLAKLLGLGG